MCIRDRSNIGKVAQIFPRIFLTVLIGIGIWETVVGEAVSLKGIIHFFQDRLGLFDLGRLDEGGKDRGHNGDHNSHYNNYHGHFYEGKA